MYLDPSEFARIAAIAGLGVADAMSFQNTLIVIGVGKRRIIHSSRNISF